MMSGSHGESIEKQAKQAVAFMRKYRDDMLLIKALRFRNSTIDFGIYDRTTEDRPWPTYRLPGPLVQLSGEFSFEMELSFYGPA